MKLKPINVVTLDNEMAIKWNDGEESYIKNRVLRNQCPCANCSGESDVFGNIYKADAQKLDQNNNTKYIINTYVRVGHYAIRIIWEDGHGSGIYSFDFLKTLG